MSTPRGIERRERIVLAAADLIATNGFHSVGVIEIGAAAGVTGAALYRHFDNKTAVLVAVFDRAIDELLRGANAVMKTATDPHDLLAALIDSHLAFALGDRSVLAVYAQEQHNLPDDDRRRLRRKQRRYVELWKQAVIALNPTTLDERRAVLRVEAVFGLLNSAHHVSSTFTDDELRTEIASTATAALTVP